MSPGRQRHLQTFKLDTAAQDTGRWSRISNATLTDCVVAYAGCMTLDAGSCINVKTCRETWIKMETEIVTMIYTMDPLCLLISPSLLFL